MTLKLNSNIAALRAVHQLGGTSASLSTVFERLSSGQRINHASDDAAGLAISTALNTNAKIFEVAVRNLNDGISIANIADGALENLTAVSNRLKELATQAANGSYSRGQRGAMDEEADALVDEYNRILSSTSFNGMNLFDGSQSQIVLQAGAGRADTISVGLVPSTSTSYVGDGSFGSVKSQIVGTGTGRPRGSAVADFNGDGRLDLVLADDLSSRAAVMFGNGDGSFLAAKTFATQGRVYSVTTGDFNGDGSIDFATADHTFGTSIFLNNGDGTFRAGATISITVVGDEIASGDLNGDGIVDLVVPHQYSAGLTVLIGNGNGTFRTGVSYASSAGSGGIELVDVTGDSKIDIVANDYTNSAIKVLAGNGDGTFGAPVSIGMGFQSYRLTTGDFNDDGIVDIAASGIGAVKVLFGNGNGSFSQGASLSVTDSYLWTIAQGDFNSDGFIDLTVKLYNTTNRVGVLFGNGDGSFRSVYEIANFGNSTSNGNAAFISVGDFNNDGVDDLSLVDGLVGLSTVLSNSRHSLRLKRLNLNTVTDARAAMTVIDQAQQNVFDLRSQIGSSSSRVNFALSVVATMRDNYLSAASRITDADIASETAQLVRFQILQQAGTAILASANQEPALVLKLLS